MRLLSSKLLALAGHTAILLTIGGCSGVSGSTGFGGGESSSGGGAGSSSGQGGGPSGSSSGAGVSGSSSGAAAGSSSSGGSGTGTGSSSSGGGGSNSSSSGGGGGSSSGSSSSSGAGSSGGARDAGIADAARSTDSSAAGDAGPFDPYQQHNLQVINNYRSQGGLRPYVLDAALSAFALAGSQELSMDHMPHQHFMNASNNGTLFTPASGFRSSAGENQGDPNGWTVLSSDPTSNETMQIDAIMAAMFAEGPSGGHYQNMMSTTFTRVGVGLLEVNNKLYLTNDFSN